MLYLHCGWPRTSTTTLQFALFEHRDQLAEAGVVFPETWLAEEMPTHNELVKALNASGQRGNRDVEEFRGFLSDHADRDMILSAEFIASELLYEKRQDALLALLSMAREVVPVTCLWTMRRFDCLVRSLYLRRMVFGRELPSPDEHTTRIRDLSTFFAGMRRVSDAVDGQVVHVKYDSRGTHNLELLRVLGLPSDVESPIRERLERGPRFNASVGHKGAVALLNLDALSARAGVELDAGAMRDAFHRGEFVFEEERRCELVGGDARRALHERALAAARQEGVSPYVDFFGSEEIESSSVDLGLDALTDDEVRQLVARFGAAVGAGSAA